MRETEARPDHRLLRALRDLAFSDGSRTAPAPRLADGREEQRYLVAAAVAALPCVAASVYYFGAYVLSLVAAAMISSAAVELAFARVRGKRLGGGGLVFAVLLVLVLPPDIPLWMAALGSAFGTLFGKEVFGGAGHHVFCPVLVGKAFLMFSYPGTVKGSSFGSMAAFGQQNAWVICAGLTLLGGFAMIVARPGNWQIICSILAAGLGLGWLVQTAGRMPYGSPVQLVAADGFLFGACFLACDPAGSPRGHVGKWIYGLLVGSAAALMRCFSAYTEVMMCAVLLGNMVSPTIDALASVEREEEAPA